MILVPEHFLLCISLTPCQEHTRTITAFHRKTQNASAVLRICAAYETTTWNRTQPCMSRMKYGRVNRSGRGKFIASLPASGQVLTQADFPRPGWGTETQTLPPGALSTQVHIDYSKGKRVYDTVSVCAIPTTGLQPFTITRRRTKTQTEPTKASCMNPQNQLKSHAWIHLLYTTAFKLWFTIPDV